MDRIQQAIADLPWDVEFKFSTQNDDEGRLVLACLREAEIEAGRRLFRALGLDKVPEYNTDSIRRSLTDEQAIAISRVVGDCVNIYMTVALSILDED